ncbi:LOW QUALITY PROTEIN: hypothetical protein PHMEG_00018252 [Phytophthora megakarya]|uniref:Ubiquitin-like protease family profile domain-containing protein n=1 Tax=Phytophthora megakarya TaxID=4795 RepID=A0A225VUT0_9STRA|nr:LOW QUALITY PROTEIN: hypothetical protein PHMEG_00018252 [Phytophthora megakarya]
MEKFGLYASDYSTPIRPANDAVTKAKRTRTSEDKPIQDRTRDRILQQVVESGVDVVLLSLNFHNAHWCCVVIRVQAKPIVYYDPINQASYVQSARQLLHISKPPAWDHLRSSSKTIHFNLMHLAAAFTYRGYSYATPLEATLWI